MVGDQSQWPIVSITNGMLKHRHEKLVEQLKSYLQALGISHIVCEQVVLPIARQSDGVTDGLTIIFSRCKPRIVSSRKVMGIPKSKR